MADLSDVMAALGSVIASAIYPNGVQQPSVVIVNRVALDVVIYPGWPIPTQLDADLAANKINVSIYAPPGMERNTTRYPRTWEITKPSVHTLTASVGGNGTTVTLGGSVSVPQNVGIICNGKSYIHQTQATDDLTTIATALAALVNVDTPASASGLIVTIPEARTLVARVGGIATASREVRRQERLFQITFWCPAVYGDVSPSAPRDAVVKLVDPVLGAMDFLNLGDGETGRLRYVRTTINDGLERANCYRRDLFYTVEYGTTQAVDAPEIIAVQERIQGAAIPFDAFTDTDPPPTTITF